MSDDFNISELSDFFFSQADEQLRQLNDGLLELERDNGNADALQQVFRIAHNLKSGAGLLDLHQVSSIAHRLEDTLQAVRDGKLELTPEVFDTLFATTDALEAALTAARSGTPVATRVAISTMPGAGQQVTPTAAAPPWEEPVATAAPPGTDEHDKDDGQRTPVHQTMHVRVDRVDRLLDLAGELTVHHLQEGQRERALRQLLRRVRIAESALLQLRQQVRTHMTSESSPLVTALSQVQQLRAELTRFAKAWRRAQAELAQLADEVQHEALAMRMVPIALAFDPLPRLARDLARKQGKLVQVVIEGRDTELDRKIVEGLSDPLTHLIRNAVDHGIEDPDERQRLGKPEQGTITLRATQRGGHVLIEVSDDGRGIDPAVVRAAAVRKGLLSQAAAAEMDDAEVVNLIFRPGFSTSTDVDGVSGRGVGMDVVKNRVQTMEGTVRLGSHVGRGTRVSMTLPLTLSITQALILRAGGQVFAIPTVAVSGLAEIAAGQGCTVGGKEVVRIGEHTVPLVHLAQVLGLSGSRTDDKPQPAMILRHGEEQVAFLVDELLGEQPVVIKPLGPILRHVEHFASGTILPNGEVALVLNPAELLSSTRRLSRPVPAPARTVRHKRRRILVVDDVIVTRELQRNILSSAGYDVDVAVDGLEALEKMGQETYDLVVADVEMPRMDGFALTEALRADERYADIPVVIVSARETEADRRRGIEVGAQAYIVKSAFDQENLLAIIEQLIG